MYICPKCRSTLELSQSSYKCTNGHCFDLSFKGYVNLLLSGKSGGHGDNKEMLRSRRDFLSLGHYSPIILRLTDMIANTIDGAAHIRILDAGCGERYYTDAVRNELLKHGITAEIHGIDVSKDGVIMAAKRYKECKFAVASVNSLPFADNSFDIVLSLFAPIAEIEFHRVLSDGGSLITVSPSPRHLWGLKNAIYDSVYENEETTFKPMLLSIAETDEYSGEMTLANNKQVSDLFKMTPYYYKTDNNGRKRAECVDQLFTEIGFKFYRFRKC